MDLFRIRRITQLLLFPFLIAAAAGADSRSGKDVTTASREVQAEIPVYRSPDARATSWRDTQATEPGENIFRAKCAVCHGLDGAGHTPNGKKLRVPDLRSKKIQNHADDELLDIVTNGKGEMPPFGKKYSAEKLQEVVAYVRHFRQTN